MGGYVRIQEGYDMIRCTFYKDSLGYTGSDLTGSRELGDEASAVIGQRREWPKLRRRWQVEKEEP